MLEISFWCKTVHLIYFLIERLHRRIIRCLCELENYEEYELCEDDDESEDEQEPYDPYQLNYDDPIEEHIEEYIGD